MRVLLVSSNRYKDPTAVLPVGVCSVASSLEAAGHEVKVLDLCFAERPGEAIAAEVARFGPELVGVGVRNLDGSNGYRPLPLHEATGREVIAPLKAAFKGPIVLGGPAVGINAPELLAHFDLEYAICGDGERAMVELVGALSGKRELASVPGLWVRREGKWVVRNAPDFIVELDALPPARPERWLDLEPYRAYDLALPVQTKRGCALECSYCTYNRLEGHRYRLRSPAKVADEIEAFVKATGVRSVEVVDSTFNVPLDHAKAVLRELGRRKLGLKVAALGVNPRFFDEELASLMREVGFCEAAFGCDAGAAPTLKSFGKNFDVSHIEQAAELVHRVGIPAVWYFILGAPQETEATLTETLQTARRVAGPFDLVMLGVGVRVYAGSPMAEEWARAHGPPAHGFLSHVGYEPQGLPLPLLKAHAEAWVARCPNFFSFDEQANVPLPFRLLFHSLWPRQPLWRAYVVGRLIEKFTGIGVLRGLVAGLRLGRARRLAARAVPALAASGAEKGRS